MALMISEHSRKTTAGQVLAVLSENNTLRDGLALLKTLMAHDAVSMDDLVEIGDPQTGDQEQLPLRHAIFELAGPSRYLSRFYSKHTAEALLELDPDFFRSQPDAVLERIQAWKQNPERDRHGFRTFKVGGKTAEADAWAATVFENLAPIDPGDSARRAFSGMLSMHMIEGAKTLAGRKTKWWLGLNERGTALVASAEDPELWNYLIDELKVDPYHPMSGNVPLWRAVLPKNSNTIAAPGSFREAVEDWVVGQIEAGHEDPRMQTHLQRNFKAIVQSQGWLKSTTSQQQTDYLRRLPKQWVGWDFDGVEAWGLPIRLNREWLVKLEPWISQGSGAMAICVWLASKKKKNKEPMPAIDAIPDNIMVKMAGDATARDLLENMRTPQTASRLAARIGLDLGIDKNQFEQFLGEVIGIIDNARMEQETAKAKNTARGGQRL